MRGGRISRRGLCAGLCAGLAALAWGCKAPPPQNPFSGVAAGLPAVPPDRARVFFYRFYELYTSVARPYVRLSGQIAGVSVPGAVFYRDVTPGHYIAAADSQGLYPDQEKPIDLAAGQTVYVKVASARRFNAGFDDYDPETFTVFIMDPVQAKTDMAQLEYIAQP